MPRIAGSRRSQPAREGACVTAGSTAGVPSSHSVGGELVSREDGSGLDVDVCERSTGLFASVDRGDDRGRVRALCPESRSLCGPSCSALKRPADPLLNGALACQADDDQPRALLVYRSDSLSGHGVC